MDVFGKGTLEPSRPLLPPGTCWTCANSPQQEAMKVIDTRRNTQAGGALSHASNRIYICEPCVIQLGKALGMASAAEHESVVQSVGGWGARVAELEVELEDARAQQHRVVDPTEILAQIEKWKTAPSSTASARKPAAKTVVPPGK